MILDEIVARKRIDLVVQQQAVPLETLQAQITCQPAPHDFASALTGPGIRLIAETKKASPSRGLLAPDFDPVALACSYVSAGAAAISVLTERHYFLGSPE